MNDPPIIRFGLRAEWPQPGRSTLTSVLDHSLDKEGINGHEQRPALYRATAPGAASSSWAEASGAPL